MNCGTGPMIFCFCTMTVISFALGIRAEDKATVRTDSAGVYAESSTESEIVKTLVKGDVVSVSYELSGTEGDWCAIVRAGESPLSGYMLCRNLERKIAAKSWKLVGTKTGRPVPESKPASAASVAPEKIKRPASEVTVVIYITDW